MQRLRSSMWNLVASNILVVTFLWFFDQGCQKSLLFFCANDNPHLVGHNESNEHGVSQRRRNCGHYYEGNLQRGTFPCNPQDIWRDETNTLVMQRAQNEPFIWAPGPFRLEKSKVNYFVLYYVEVMCPMRFKICLKNKTGLYVCRFPEEPQSFHLSAVPCIKDEKRPWHDTA